MAIRLKLKRCLNNFRKAFGFSLFTPYITTYDFFGKPAKFWIFNEDAERWYFPSLLERAELKELKRLAQGSLRILDIGTHHGFVAMLLASHMKDGGQVFGVESYPENVVVAQAQTALNEFTNIKILNFACCDREDGTVSISRLHNSAVQARDSRKCISVAATTVDALDRQYGPFDMLKIDVEGYEFEVLKGAEKTLKRLPKVALEIHINALKKRGIKVEDVLGLIEHDHYVVTMEDTMDEKAVVPFQSSMLPDRREFASVFFTPKT